MKERAVLQKRIEGGRSRLEEHKSQPLSESFKLVNHLFRGLFGINARELLIVE